MELGRPKSACLALPFGLVFGAVAFGGGFDWVTQVQRCVLVEDFTATWCGPCVYAGQALSQLQDTYPDTVAVLQIHVSDCCDIPWGMDRFYSYPNHASLPNVWFDGVLQKLGADQNVYDVYLSMYNARQSVPTDVTVEVGATQVAGPTYQFQVRVSLAPAGVPKTVRVYLVQALDHYPAGGHHRNCLMAAADTQDITLQPGQSQIIERSMTFDSTSWSQPGNIRAFAWAQVPGSSGVREVYQARQAFWPFGPLPPLYQVGDMNCDGSVGFGDINPFVLAMVNPQQYAIQYPGCPMEYVGDINGDGQFGFADINPFVALLTRTGP